jgi:hypothetical protein
MKKFILSCVVILSISCTVPERYVVYQSQEQQKESKSQYLDTTDNTGDRGIRFKGGDGSSMENAIIICGAKNEIEGVPAEIDYISRRHGERDKSWKMIMQSDFKKNDKIYVEYQIEDYKKGMKAVYFFDNTAFYSAYLKAPPVPSATSLPPKQPQKEPQQPQIDPPITLQTAVEKTENSGVWYKGGDGSSMENAIIIVGPKNEKEVIMAVFDYISRRHGVKDEFWKIIMQGNFRKDFKHYRQFSIKDFTNGNRFDYCFDVTAVFGK